jgi:hypothetical protein
MNAKPAWRKDDDAAEGGMENRHERDALGVDLGLGSDFERFCPCVIPSPSCAPDPVAPPRKRS